MFKNIFKRKPTINNVPKPQWYLIIVMKNSSTFTIASNDENPPLVFNECVDWFISETSPLYRKQPMWDDKGCVALRKDEIEFMYITPIK